MRTGGGINIKASKNDRILEMSGGVDSFEKLSGGMGTRISVRNVWGEDGKHDSQARQYAEENNTIMQEDSELIFINSGTELDNHLFDNNGKGYFLNDDDTDKPGKSINNAVRNGGEIHVSAGGLSQESKIEYGGTEIVQASRGKQGFSENAIVKEGGQQRIENGGKAQGTKIYGGKQLVFGEGDVRGKMKGSSASDIVIYGQGKTLGRQEVYDGGSVWNTEVMQGGVQEVAKKIKVQEMVVLRLILKSLVVVSRIS